MDYSSDFKAYPLLMEPVLKDYIWGGNRLSEVFGKKSDLEKVAESWEVSTQNGNQSRIANGEYEGMPLDEYIALNREKILGKNCAQMTEFPVLIKLIDAKDNLSVQVHPNDEYVENGQSGKTEMWYVVDAEPDASIILGFSREITKDEFIRRIKNNTLLEVLNKIPVKKGDVFYVKAGTLHAIGKGILIAEIQQNSDITYRVFDYGRTDKNGNPRELHINDALEVTKRTPPEDDYKSLNLTCGDGETLLVKNRYFCVYKCVDTKTINVTDESFCVLLFIDGDGELLYEGKQLKVRRGDSVFIPAGFGKINLEGNFTALKTTIEN
ncbi:MAG: class I mannose-6-phosphate isomerase [Ruminococcus sp.]|nr:class I mannose-6-phosphate isomerase [Ruminococcus sp.]